MKTNFRIGKNDTVKATLHNGLTGKLLCTLYDSGFTTIAQVKSALLGKYQFPPKHYEIGILNETKDSYWSNRTK